MKRRHELVRSVEWKLGHARVRLARAGGVEAAFLGEDDERSLRRVADELTFCHDGVGSEQHWQQELLERDVRLPSNVLDRPLRRVASAGDGVASAWDRQLDRRHLVERQRAGLVGVDRRCRAERLRCAQAFHDRVRASEDLCSERKNRRHDGGKPRRYRRNGERDCGSEDRGERVAA